MFTTETVDGSRERVSAYRLTDGSRLWQRAWEDSLTVPFFAAANGSWIRSTPAAAVGPDGASHLVVMGMRDRLVDLDPADGSVRWEVSLASLDDASLEAFGGVCSPLIDGDSVYVQSGAGTVRLDLADGSVRWRVPDETGGMSGGAFSSPILARIDGVRTLVVQTRTELTGLNPEDGTVGWRQPIEAFRGMNILTPLVVGDGAGIFTAAHSGRCERYDVSRVDGRWRSSLRWQQKGQGYMSSPVLVDGNIYLHLKNGRMRCLDAADGTIRWTGSPIGKYASLISDGRTLASLSDDGRLRLIAADPDEYRVMDEATVAEDSWAHLAVVDDGWLVRDLGSLARFDW